MPYPSPKYEHFELKAVRSFLNFFFWLIFILIGIPLAVVAFATMIVFVWAPIIKYLMDLLP